MMKKQSIYGVFGVVFGVSLLILVPVQNSSAESQKNGFTMIWGYHGGHNSHNRYNDKYHKKNHNYDHKWNNGYGKSHNHEHDYEFHGSRSSLPFGSIKLRVDSDLYRYHNGIFYKKCRIRGYDIVPAPIGALVRYLPSKYRVTYRQGKKYYHHDNTYFKKTGHGYRVIEKPDIQISYHHGYHDDYSYSKYRRKCR